MRNWNVLILSLFLLSNTACERLSNSFSDKVLACGEDARPLAASQLLKVLDEGSIEGLWQNEQGFSKLSQSSLGCFILPKDKGGKAYLRDRDKSKGAVFVPKQNTQHLTTLTLENRPEGLLTQSSTLGCGDAASQGRFAKPLARFESSGQLKLYRLDYSLIRDTDLLQKGSLELHEDETPRIPLPLILADGSYQLQLHLRDMFREQFQELSSEDLSCPLRIDTTPPSVTGLSDKLTLLNSGSDPKLEVYPGQELRFAVKDAGQAFIWSCLEPIEGPACSDFVANNGRLNAPEAGAWRIRYYAKDELGNQSPVATLPPLLVINRARMFQVQNQINVVRLNLKDGLWLDAALNLVEAYRVLASLKLPEEREELAQDITRVWSDLGAKNHLHIHWKLPEAKLKQFVQRKDRSLLELYDNGVLIERQADGRVTDTLKDVEDVLLGADDVPLIRFRTQELSLGFAGFKRSLPRAFGLIYARSWNPQTGELLLSHAQGFSLLTWQTLLGWREQWSYQLPQSEGSRWLDIRDEDVYFTSLDGIYRARKDDGSIQAEAHWDKRCTIGALVDAGASGFYMTLRNYQKPTGVAENENYNCPLSVWKSGEELHKVDLSLFPQLAGLKIEDSTILAYDPTRHLLIAGVGGAAIYLVYDVQRSKAIAFDVAGGHPSPTAGQQYPNEILMSPDFTYIAMANIKDGFLDLYKTEDLSKLLAVEDFFDPDFRFPEPIAYTAKYGLTLKQLRWDLENFEIFAVDSQGYLSSFRMQQPLAIPSSVNAGSVDIQAKTLCEWMLPNLTAQGPEKHQPQIHFCQSILGL